MANLMVGRFYLKSAGFIAKIGEVVRGQKNLLDDPSFHNNLEEQRFAARPVAGGVHPKTRRGYYRYLPQEGRYTLAFVLSPSWNSKASLFGGFRAGRPRRGV